MKTDYSKLLKLMVLAGMLPFIYGCGGAGGSGVGSLVGFLFGGGGAGGGEIALLGLGSTVDGGAGLLGGGAGLASIHNPEPASMLLLGSGLMAMGFFKSKTNKGKK